MVHCITSNNWTDEKRVLELIPGALTGQALRVYSSFTTAQKASLESVFAAMKQSLNPEGKTHNRDLFIKAKRGPGESMRSFISRCNEYITRADEIDNVEESTWAGPFVVEKIYANLNIGDRKVLKGSMGKSEDVQALCEKADELLAISEDVVGSLDTCPRRGWQSQPPRPMPTRTNNQWRPRRPGPGWGSDGWGPQHAGGWNGGRGMPFHPNSTHMFRPGGGYPRRNRGRGPRIAPKPNNPPQEASANPLNLPSPLQQG